MNKFMALTEVTEREEFQGSTVLLISSEGGHLEVTPFGGDFQEDDHFHNEEVFYLTKHLLEQAATYNGGLQKGEIQ